MEDTNWQDVLNRLFKATNSTNETALAARLGISSQSVYNARNKQQIPPAWIFEIAKNYHVSADWLFFGRDPMHPGDTNVSDPPQKTAHSCARCAELEAELKLERLERRELSAENRQWAAKMERLLRENGELQARCATLEERQKNFSPTTVFGTPPITSSSESQVEG